MNTRVFLVVLLTTVISFSGCGKKDEKSDKCLITSFVVGGANWEINDVNGTITGSYPKATVIGSFFPVIDVSEGAKVSPASGVSQDFSDEKEVIYTVTAENGKNTKEYKARAVKKLQ